MCSVICRSSTAQCGEALENPRCFVTVGQSALSHNVSQCLYSHHPKYQCRPDITATRAKDQTSNNQNQGHHWCHRYCKILGLNVPTLSHADQVLQQRFTSTFLMQLAPDGLWPFLAIVITLFITSDLHVGTAGSRSGPCACHMWEVRWADVLVSWDFIRSLMCKNWSELVYYIYNSMCSRPATTNHGFVLLAIAVKKPTTWEKNSLGFNLYPSTGRSKQNLPPHHHYLKGSV